MNYKLTNILQKLHLLLSNNSKGLQNSLANVALRGVTMLSKFFLIVYLAKILPAEEIGTYGLFVVVISFALFLVGVDIYVYFQRQIFSQPKENWALIIKNQFACYSIIYCVALPLLLFVFIGEYVSWNVMGWFYLLLVLEHLSQELNRILIAIQRPLLAGWALFFRSGAWAYITIIILWQEPALRDLNTVWAGWSVGAFMSIVLSIWALRELDWNKAFSTPWRLQWLRGSLGVGLFFIAGTLALRGIFTVDRYILDYFSGREAVGVYTFYIAIATTIQSFVDAGVIVHFYPKLVSTFRQRKMSEYTEILSKMVVAIVIAVLVLTCIAVIMIHPVLGYISKPVYTDNVAVFYVLLIAAGVSCFSFIPHFILYARQSDFSIQGAAFMGLLTLIVISFILVPVYEGLGLALAMLGSMLMIALFKAVAVKV